MARMLEVTGPWPDGPCTLLPALRAMLAGLPFSVAEGLDARAVCHPTGHFKEMYREGKSKFNGPSAQ